jgi:hypothetical protein
VEGRNADAVKGARLDQRQPEGGRRGRGRLPSRDGASYMRMRTIKKADGTVLGTLVRNQRAD